MTCRDNQGYFQPAFLICVAILASVGTAMLVADVHWQKEPMPLKKPLDELDRAALSPFRVVGEQKIENKEILKSLGTEDYIQWVLEDPCQPISSGARRLMLFITYYRLPDRVPHVPEECYTGGGYQLLGTEPVTFEVPSGSNRELLEVPGSYLEFARTGTSVALTVPKFPVLYLFGVNGEFAGNRDRARITLNKNIFGSHSYFSKVELVFNQSISAPSKAEAVAVSEKLLAVLLPQLKTVHWPDWPNP